MKNKLKTQITIKQSPDGNLYLGGESTIVVWRDQTLQPGEEELIYNAFVPGFNILTSASTKDGAYTRATNEANAFVKMLSGLGLTKLSMTLKEMGFVSQKPVEFISRVTEDQLPVVHSSKIEAKQITVGCQ